LLLSANNKSFLVKRLLKAFSRGGDLMKKIKVIGLSAALVAGLISIPAQASADDGSVGALYLTIKSDDQKLALQYAGRPDGKEMYFRISGTVYAQVPGGGPAAPAMRQGAKLWNLEGYNVRKLVRNGEYIYLVSREILYYTDPADPTKILTTWKSTYDGKTYPVVPILNDTVNSVYRVKNGVLYGVPAAIGTPAQVEAPVGPPTTLGDGTKVFVSDIPLNYGLDDDGRYGIKDPFGFATGYTSRASDKFTGTTARYTGLEAFDFWIAKPGQMRMLPKNAAGEARVPSGPAPFYNSWARVSPMPPFTCIGEAATGIHAIYHARAWTLSTWNKVEKWLRDAVVATDAQYINAPSTAPVMAGSSADRFIPLWKNQTSWSAFFNSQLKGKGTAGADLTWATWCTNNAK
jgi:Protein of unknown function (DUF1838)